MLELTQRHCKPGTGILCGNSIWQDRRFLVRYMPRFLEHLHYRMIDVSTLKALVQAWKPEAVREKSSDHTALNDIRQSIAELHHYRQVLFR
jgi:oligoribonuclease